MTEDAAARLDALCETDDGFRLAERDLEIRGAGHLFGTRQSGATGFRFASLIEDQGLLGQAAELAERILAADPDLSDPAHEGARQAVARWEASAAVREDAG